MLVSVKKLQGSSVNHNLIARVTVDLFFLYTKITCYLSEHLGLHVAGEQLLMEMPLVLGIHVRLASIRGAENEECNTWQRKTRNLLSNGMCLA